MFKDVVIPVLKCNHPCSYCLKRDKCARFISFKKRIPEDEAIKLILELKN